MNTEQGYNRKTQLFTIELLIKTRKEKNRIKISATPTEASTEPEETMNERAKKVFVP